MGQILLSTNGNRIALIPRSASHSLAATWLQQSEPNNYALWQSQPFMHPARFLTHQEIPSQVPSGVPLACLVRNPIERFRSMIAHRELDIEHQLEKPVYGPIPSLPYTHYFRFEDQLQDCAYWLGITLPIPNLDSTINKPILTPQQEDKVREIYAADLKLWQSLQSH